MVRRFPNQDAGRQWDALSESYRNRLERHGITAHDYERGVSVQAARGHSQGEGKERLARDIDRLKSAEYGHKESFNKARSEKAVRERPDGSSRTKAEMRAVLAFMEGDEDYDYEEWQDEIDDALYYH